MHFCTISKEKVYGPFFVAEAVVTGTSYLEMMQEWLMPQLYDHAAVGMGGNGLSA
jgi:hypothetical protein